MILFNKLHAKEIKQIKTIWAQLQPYLRVRQNWKILDITNYASMAAKIDTILEYTIRGLISNSQLLTYLTDTFGKKFMLWYTEGHVALLNKLHSNSIIVTTLE